MKISTYDKPIVRPARSGAGRKPSDTTLALMAAIEASAGDGKGRRWEGAGTEYQKNAVKLRQIAGRINFAVYVGLDGNDLTFSATPAVEKKQKPTAVVTAVETDKQPEATKRPTRKSVK